MRDLTSQSRAKDVLVTEPDHAIVVESYGRPRKRKKRLATFEMEGAYQSESTKWWFRLLLKVFGR